MTPWHASGTLPGMRETFYSHGEWRIVDRRDALQRGASEDALTPLDSHRRKDAAEFRATEAWVEIPLGNEWTAACRLLPQGGVPIVAELRVYPRDPSGRHSPGRWSGEFAGVKARVPPGGLSTRLLRGLRLSASSTAWKGFRQAMQKLPENHEWVKRWHGFSVDSEERPKREYRRGRPDIFYARIAARYCRILHAGRRNAVQIIASSIKQPESKVRDMVLQARKRGLLTRPPKQGRMGGQLTPKAERLLRPERKAKRGEGHSRPKPARTKKRR